MATDLQRAFVRLPGEGRLIGLGNFAMSLLADSGETGGSFTLLEAAEPPDFGPPMHIHRNAAEAFYVLEGLYRMFIEDASFDCPAGSLIFVPAGIRHGFRVGGAPSRKLNLYSPAAMVGYFDDLSAAIQSGQMDAEHLTEMALSHGMEVVGPAPEGYL